MSDDRVHVPNDYSEPVYYPSQGGPQPPQPPQPPQRRGWSGGAIVAAAVAGSIIGGILMASAMLLLFGLPLTAVTSPGAPAQQRQTTPTTPLASSETTAQDEPIEAVAAKVTPSVVIVSIEQRSTNPFTGATGNQVVGNGSGVIIRQDGYIMTNAHVVSGASAVTVKIGEDEVPAKVVGADAASDIAVIKVEKTGLTAAVLGDSDTLRVGETVVAVGSPFGLDKTVTSGIISALHRTGEAADQTQLTIYSNLIQTDAAINPGNSGGALADLSGDVIGINTLIQTGGASQSAGVGFAIPIKLAKQVADQLISTGKATHTFLGVAAVDVTSANAKQLGVQATSGALIQDVQAGSPAEKAGLKRGDVIVKIGTDVIKDSQDMVAAVRSHSPGDKVTITLERGSQQMTIDVTLGTSS